jgi:ribosomal protein L7/L12
MQMSHAVKQLKKYLALGETLEAALVKLHINGFTPLEAIKAVHLVQGVNLAEAKRIFSNSPAWRAEHEAVEPLHDELLTELGKLQGSETSR